MIHLACIAQLINDPMGIRSEFKDHFLTWEAYVSLKPKGGGFGWDFVCQRSFPRDEVPGDAGFGPDGRAGRPSKALG